MTDYIGYEALTQAAMRGVVREALRETARNKAAPGEHHFYITFKTNHPGVEIPDHLRHRYPDEMTIVLQHQFWDLEVEPERFSVALSFDGKADTLRIPFDSIAAFADPSVKFGLQFGQDGELEGVDDSSLREDEDLSELPDDKAARGSLPAAAGSEEPAGTQNNEEQAPAGDDKVVTLDRFRKKPVDR